MIIIKKYINLKKTINNTIFIIISIIFSYFISSTNISFGIGNFEVNILLLLLLSILFVVNIKEIFKNNKFVCVIFIFQILFLLLSFLININAGLGSIIIVIIFSLIIQITLSINIDGKTYKMVLPIYFIFLLYSLIINFTNYDVNTNNAAANIFNLCILTISAISILFNKKIIRKGSILILLIVSLINCFKYDSRNITIVFLFMIIVSIFDLSKYLNKNKNKKINMYFLIISILSLVVTIIYVYMYNKNIIFTLNFSEKSFFTGREKIWVSVYNAFKKYPLFGIGSNSPFFPTGGIHNYMLNVLALFGIPHFILFLIILYNYVKKLFSININSRNYLPLLSILSLFITEYFEASFIGGGKLATLFLLSIMFISSSNIVTNGEKI